MDELDGKPSGAFFIRRFGNRIGRNIRGDQPRDCLPADTRAALLPDHRTQCRDAENTVEQFSHGLPSGDRCCRRSLPLHALAKRDQAQKEPGARMPKIGKPRPQAGVLTSTVEKEN